jgi:hypothetical protein
MSTSGVATKHWNWWLYWPVSLYRFELVRGFFMRFCFVADILLLVFGVLVGCLSESQSFLENNSQ